MYFIFLSLQERTPFNYSSASWIWLCLIWLLLWNVFFLSHFPGISLHTSLFLTVFASNSLFVPNGVLPSVGRAIGIYYGDQRVWSLTQSPIWCFLVSLLPFLVFKNISVVRKIANFPFFLLHAFYFCCRITFNLRKKMTSIFLCLSFCWKKVKQYRFLTEKWGIYHGFTLYLLFSHLPVFYHVTSVSIS